MPNLNSQNLESYIMFYGQQKCQPDEFFQGDNLRKNDILYYIINGQGTFTSSRHHIVKLQAGDLFYVPRNQTCSFQADHNEPWEYFWIGLAGSGVNESIKASNLPNKKFLAANSKNRFLSNAQ